MLSSVSSSTPYRPPRRGIVATSSSTATVSASPLGRSPPSGPVTPTHSTRRTSNLFTLVRHIAYSIAILTKSHQFTNSPSIQISTLDGETTEFLGRGKTFSVSRIPLPEVVGLENTWPKRLVLREPVFTVGPRGYLQEAITCKRSLIELDVLGNAKDGADEERLEAVVLEIRVLTHPPLYLHRNIVDFLGVNWQCESGWFEPGVEKIGIPRRVPAILMEYARHGSLEDFRKSDEYKSMGFQGRARLCRDVAEGLKTLHDCHVVHGDVKLGNVLVFDDPCGGMVAKLADFGFSVGEEHLAERGVDGIPRWRMRGRTWPWNDPEWNRPRDWSQLMKTDVFSYGLLVWTILTGKEVESLFDLDQEMARSSRHDPEIRDTVEGMKDWTLTFNAAGYFKDRHENVRLLVQCLFHCALDARVESRGLMKDIISIWDIWFMNSPPYQAYSPGTPPPIIKRVQNINYVQLETIVAFMSDTPASVKHQFVAIHQQPYLSRDEKSESTLFRGLAHFIGWGVPINFEAGKQLIDEAAGITWNAAIYQPMFFDDGPRDFYSTFDMNCNEYEHIVLISLLKLVTMGGSYEALLQLRRYFPMPCDVQYRRMLCTMFRKRRYGIIDEDYPSRFHEEGSSELQMQQWEDIQRNYRRVPTAELQHNVLHYAVISGFAEVVQQMLETKDFDDVLLEQRDIYGNTPLMLAFQLGLFRIAQLLIEAGSDVRTRNRLGESLLHFLDEFGDLDEMSQIADLVMALGAKDVINAGCTDRSYPMEVVTGMPPTHGAPLVSAIMKNNIPLVKIFLKYGADLFAGEERSPVVIAAMGHFIDTLELFWTACPWAPGWMDPILFIGAIKGSTGVQLMYFHGARGTKQAMERTIDFLFDKTRINRRIEGFPVLHWIVEYGSLDMLAYVMGRLEEEINNYSVGGITSLHKAMLHGSVDKLKLLLEHGGDPTLPVTMHTPISSLRLACAQWGGDPEMVQYLLDLGLAQDHDWERTIIQAIGKCNFEVAQLLIDAGVDIDTLDEKGWTPLGLIVRTCTHNSVDQLRFLLDHQMALGKKPAGFIGIPKTKKTLLHLVAGIPCTSPFYDRATMADVIDFLLDKFNTPEELNAQDIEGLTALHIAAESGNVILAQRLLDFDTVERDMLCHAHGLTAYYYAVAFMVKGAPREALELGGKRAEERWKEDALEIVSLLEPDETSDPLVYGAALDL